MSEDVRETSTDFGLPVLDVELSRPYSPGVVLWQLTSTGTKRVDDQTLPGRLPFDAYRTLHLLRKLEYAEEDEISNHLEMTLEAVRSTIKRLVGYGYVQQVQLQEQ